MAVSQPIASDKLDSPAHAKLHRVIAVDTAADDESLYVDAAGNTIVKNNIKDVSGENQFTPRNVVKNQLNIMLMGFKLAALESLAKYNLVNGMVDEYVDETGIDADASVNELYNSTDDYYYPDTGTNMTLQSTGTEATGSTPDDVRIALFEEDVDAITLNTDLKAWVSRDEGTTWTQLTLVDEGYYETSQRVLTGIGDISGQPVVSTFNMKYKLTTHNNKDLKIHGAAMNWSA